MAFRENLKSELEFQDIKVKELAAKSGISRRTIDQYLSSAAKMPSAENAVKIAQVLGVTVEYLVTGKTSESSDRIIEQEIKLFQKYRQLIKKIEMLSLPAKECIDFFVNKLGNE
ncbi:helix-turn-helix domain-containing protein [Treponema zioleckii]|uniref:helix-turn-helix domain-containing protein n=1 Tax=Treponema zioleckii TaxID=331680 RepID=UPI00168B23B9|nr:helix-turn-helix transcriptional regulator [Treponema zioleckii]